MKILLISVFMLFGLVSMNAQIAVTYTRTESFAVTRKAPIVKKKSSEKMHSSLKRTVKVIREEKEVDTKATVIYSKRSQKKFSEEEEEDEAEF